MYRYKEYKPANRKDHTAATCPFCNLGDRKILAQTEHVLVIPSDYPYDLWEFRNVTDHLLIIPRRHIASLAELTPAERADIAEFMGHYEGRGYNIYVRSDKSVSKSIPDHQHTHLLSTEDKKSNVAIFIRKPYWLFKR